MKFIILILSLTLLTSCIGASSGTSKITRAGSAGPVPPGTPVRWPASSLVAPLEIKTSESFTDEFVPADLDASSNHPVDQMAKQWNDAHDSITFIKVPSTIVANKGYTDVSQYRDSEMGVYKSFTWFDDVSSSALAITQYYGYRRNVGSASEYIEIQHADIIVNYRDYSFSTDDQDNGTYDLSSVLLHEFGHLLGLPHSWDWSNPSVMEPYLGITSSQRVVEAADIAKIRENYSAGASLSNNQANGFATFSPVPGEGEEVQGTFQLRANGTCHHYINKKKTLVH